MSGNNIAPLTFGVEFEFVIKTTLTTVKNGKVFYGQDPEPNDARPATWSMSDVSEEKSKYIKRNDTFQQLRKVLHRSGLGIEIDHEEADQTDYTKWQVKPDSSVQTEPENKKLLYEYHSAEVTTPIYFASDKNNMGLDEIRRVLTILRNNFRVHVPSSAGLHVHVGNGSTGFTTSHMKNLISILHVFDPQIQVLHPNRQYSDDSIEYTEQQANFNNYYRAPYRCNLGLYLAGDTSRRLPQILDTKPDLSQEIVELSGLDAHPDGPTEFSQARRFLRNEKEVAREHVRIRQLFATGPESFVSIGGTNILDSEPGSIAQRLFRKEPVGIPLLDTESADNLGPRLLAHLEENLHQDLDPEIKALLKDSDTTLKPYENSEPRTLLAPVKLLQSKTMQELSSRAGAPGADRVAYNILNLASGEKYRYCVPQTIEFRQHQGTLDADKVVAWVQMVVGMVEWTRSASQVEIANLLRFGGTVKPEDFDVVDLLRYMNLDESADYYEREFFEMR